MALKEEFRSQGDWLFRHRSWLPLIFLIPVVWTLRGFELPLAQTEWLLCCFGIVMIGQFIRAHSVGHAPIGTSGRNTSEGQIAICVNQTGFYSVLRHPLYLGNYFMWLGVIAYSASPALIVIFTLAFYLYYERIMFAEEAFLRDKFGQEYEDWAAKTPAFIPRLTGWVPPKDPLQPKVIVRQEYLGLCSAVLLLSLLAMTGDYFATGEWTMSEFNRSFLGSAVVGFIVIRILVKGTKVLGTRTAS